MTTLKQILVNRDSGLLRIFFETWGIETGIPVEKSNFIEKFEQFVVSYVLVGLTQLHFDLNSRYEYELTYH